MLETAFVALIQAGRELEIKIRMNRNHIGSTAGDSIERKVIFVCETVGLRHQSSLHGYPNVRRHDTIRRTGCLRTTTNERVPRSFHGWVELT